MATFSRKGFAKRERAGNRWKKNAASDRSDRSVVGTRHGRRSDQRFEVDAQDDRKSCPTIEAVEDRGEPEHGGAAVERDGIGEKIADREMTELCLNRHETNPNWNYTLTPHGSSKM